MTNELQLIKSAQFGDVQADIYRQNEEMYMTTEQLGACLGYTQPKPAISKILHRNPYLNNMEFSGVTNLTTPEGGAQNTRLFTEDGIYEVTFLAKTEKAREFRTWVRSLLKSLRKGELHLAQENVSFSPEIIESIIQKYLPRINHTTLNTWKKYVAKPLIKAIESCSQMDTKECYSCVYSAMAQKFGFNSACAIMQFRDKYFVDDTSTIDVIADNPTYQQQFVMAGNYILEMLSNQFVTNTSEAEQTDTSEVTDIVRFTIDDDIDNVIEAVSKLRGDNSTSKIGTYRYIYSQMNTPRGWKCVMSRHRKHTKRSIIESNVNQKKKFIAVCNNIVNNSQMEA